MRTSNDRIDRPAGDKHRNALLRIRGWVARLLVRAAGMISREREEETADAPPDDAAGEATLDPLEQWRARVREGAPELLLPPEQGGIPPVVYRPPTPGMQSVSVDSDASVKLLRVRAESAIPTETGAARSSVVRATEERAEAIVRRNRDVAPAAAEVVEAKRAMPTQPPMNRREHTGMKDGENRHEHATAGDGRKNSEVARPEPLRRVQAVEPQTKKQSERIEERSALGKKAASVFAEHTLTDRKQRPAVWPQRWADLPRLKREESPEKVAVGTQRVEEAKPSVEGGSGWPLLDVRQEPGSPADSVGSSEQRMPRHEQWSDVDRVLERTSVEVLQDSVFLDEARWPELLPESSVEQQSWARALAEQEHWRALDAEQRGAA